MESTDIFALNTPEIKELKAAAFETILFFPGLDFQQWCQVLLKEYTEEVVDALGDDAQQVMNDLTELWTSSYTDPTTEICKKYCEWATILKNKEMIGNYYKLVEEANQKKGIK